MHSTTFQPWNIKEFTQRIYPFLCTLSLPKRALSSVVLLDTIPSMSSSYLIGGGLYLPDPETCGLNGQKLARARELQPLLKQLDARNLGRELRN